MGWSSATFSGGWCSNPKGGSTRPLAAWQRAISHERTNYVHWLILARIETERGRYTVALRDYNQARRLGGKYQVFELSPGYGQW